VDTYGAGASWSAPSEAAFELRHADIQLLQAVAEHGSLRAASRLSRTTQSTASRRLAYLERRLNARLLTRGPSGAWLTDDGWALVRAGQDLLDALGRAVRQVTGGQQHGAGKMVPSLRMAAIGRHWEDLADDLARWLPRVVLDVMSREPAESLGMFERYDVDAVYGWDVSARAFTSRRPTLRLPVTAEPLWAMLPANHPRAAAGAVRLADLAADAWVLPHDDGDRAVVLEALRDRGIHTSVAYVTDSMATLHSLVAHGHGVALASPLTRRSSSASLVLRPVVDAPIRRIFLAVDPTVVPEPLAVVVRDRLRVHYAACAARDNPEYRNWPLFPLPRATDGDDAGQRPSLVSHLTVSRTLTPASPAAGPAPADHGGSALLEPEHLYLLRVVERAGSLNRAAPLLLITQPALTRRVHLLERATGRTLLQRSPRGTVLSAAARQLLAQTEQAETALAALVARFRQEPRILARPSRRSTARATATEPAAGTEPASATTA
jgi:DNA-binding transcriptional LysR family regulator